MSTITTAITTIASTDTVSASRSTRPLLAQRILEGHRAGWSPAASPSPEGMEPGFSEGELWTPTRTTVLDLWMAGHHEDAPPTEFSPRGISGAVRRTVCRCRYRARWDGRLPPRSRTDFGPAWAKRASRGPVRHRPITSPPRSWSRRAHRAPCRDCR